MSLSKREQIVLSRLRDWEEQLFDYQTRGFEKSYDKWLEFAFNQLPQNLQNRFFQTVDHWLLQLHGLLQGSQSQNDARHRILKAVNLQYPYIKEIEELKQLPIDQLIYLAEQEISKHRLYSLAQGGLTGAGGILFLAADIPLMTAINLRSVQLLSLIYGYEVNRPFEMVTSLKVFHAAILPKRLQGSEWKGLIAHLENANDSYFWFDGTENLSNHTLMDIPLKQLVKTMFIFSVKRKLIQGLPLIGMGVGAGINYKLTSQVTEFAHRFYQLRYLMEKGE